MRPTHRLYTRGPRAYGCDLLGVKTTTNKLPMWLLGIHWLIIINFVTQILYGAYMTFFVVSPGTSGPLWGAAKSVPFELMVTRRLYASETWIAIVGLSLYVAVTEVLPRRLGGDRA